MLQSFHSEHWASNLRISSMYSHCALRSFEVNDIRNGLFFAKPGYFICTTLRCIALHRSSRYCYRYLTDEPDPAGFENAQSFYSHIIYGLPVYLCRKPGEVLAHVCVYSLYRPLLPPLIAHNCVRLSKAPLLEV